MSTQSERAMAAVREGMQVVDRAGEKVGKVEDVHFGDPDAITTEGQQSDDPHLPRGMANQLLRTGYVKVGLGMFRGHRFASPDQLDRVDEDHVVHLSVEGTALAG
jgi:hypothetical protein